MSDWEPQDGITGTGGGGDEPTIAPKAAQNQKDRPVTNPPHKATLKVVPNDEPPAYLNEGPPLDQYEFEEQRPLHREIKSQLKTPIDGALLSNLPLIRAGKAGDGAPKPLMANVVTLLRAESRFFNLRYDEFSMRSYRGDTKLTDDDFLDITNWVQRAGIHAEMRAVQQAVTMVSQDQRYHQVRDYLETLGWDHVPRLAKLLIDNAGAPDTDIVQQMTFRWFVQAVARVYRPGCQADSMLILEGKQGLRKSSFFEVIGGQWYVAGLSDITSKDAKQELRGVWIIEMAEMNAMRRSETNAMKAFLTQKTDHYRESYGRITSDFPRQCVFAGTINPGGEGYLKDETGARRFWPIPIADEIDLDNIRRWRDQLWAEAVYWFKKDHPWYLDTVELNAAATEVQSDRYEEDEWGYPIGEYLDTPRFPDPGHFTTTELLTKAIKIEDIAKIGDREQRRVAKIMKRLGYERKKVRMSDMGNKPKWAFVKSVT